MVTHGEAPKDVFVKRYGRMRNGRYEQVQSALRGSRRQISKGYSPDQLDFGF